MLFEGQSLAERSVPVSLGRRALAWVIDAVLVAVLTAAAIRLVMELRAPRGVVVHLWQFPAKWIAPVVFLAWVLYRALTESSGATVGKWLCGVRVYRRAGKLKFHHALLRSLTAPFDTLVGHLEFEGPVDRKMQVKLEPERRTRKRVLKARYVVVIGLAAVSAGWLIVTPTSRLLKELHGLEANGKCGMVPREVLRFTDRAEHGRSAFLDRCDDVLRQVAGRANDGDSAALDEVRRLPYAHDWGFSGHRETAQGDAP